jgi:bifunctional ADP-heptose synthase (sugar kinase/adenylyltransferase)
LIAAIHPDVLVKGGDWNPSEIVGNDIVSSYGGDVLTIPFIEGYSTSDIIEKIKES